MDDNIISIIGQTPLCIQFSEYDLKLDQVGNLWYGRAVHHIKVRIRNGYRHTEDSESYLCLSLNNVQKYTHMQKVEEKGRRDFENKWSNFEKGYGIVLLINHSETYLLATFNN